MLYRSLIGSSFRPRKFIIQAPLLALLLFSFLAPTAKAHPLGNFTINHYARLEVGGAPLRLRYVVDMAEIAAFQELQTVDADQNGATSDAELNLYLEQAAARYPDGFLLTVNGSRIPLRVTGKRISLPPGAGGLPTLRMEFDFVADVVVATADVNASQQLRFEDINHQGRIGWREIVVAPVAGAQVFNSNAYGNGVSNELKTYPEDMLAAPLNERVAELSWTTAGAVPPDARALLTRDGRVAAPATRDRLAELIAVPQLTPALAFLGLLIACALGALHALSPGHGKTVVGAYLVGTRGTARHAAFLGLTVTVTHTLGVFLLGVVTLFASQYVVPERLFPILGFVSGAIVLGIGLSLFVRRLRAALGFEPHVHSHHAHAHDHAHDHSHEHDHDPHDSDAALVHSHGGRAHSHLPPGTDGSRVTWRSLLALGVSGGLLPCPSALVVLLSAISFRRVGYGLLLVVAFSIGLAATLTAIGLAFVYAGRLLKRRTGAGRLVKVLPALSAFVIACVGAGICYQALTQAGFDVSSTLSAFASNTATPVNSISTASVLGLGFVLGLKHAMEADHLAAVTTIVSERKSLLSSSLVGGLWGVGHTISLLVAGVAVILLHVKVGERTALALEFCVGIMLVLLGANAVRKLSRPGSRLHLHTHRHGGRLHVHPHLHDDAPDPELETHHGFRLSARPLVIGLVHGLAGSAALMLLVLSTIPAPLVGLLYIVVFGVGSIGGMMAMSTLVGLPVHLTAGRFTRLNFAVRAGAGLFSLGFGLFMMYEIGYVEGLLR